MENPMIHLAGIIDSDQDPDELFERIELIGQGTYGQVFKALARETGNIVAVKIVPVSSDLISLSKEI